jgi:hypothetical protein|eukprot:COSAG01_NODE_1201_length_11274_cov_639.212349_10_plen_100_part_00
MLRIRFKKTFRKAKKLDRTDESMSGMDLGLQLQLDEIDVFMHFVMQPLRLTINPGLLPVLLSYVELGNDEGIKQVGSAIQSFIEGVSTCSSLYSVVMLQ